MTEMDQPLDTRGVVAEAMGTSILLAAVVGSGIMGERLAGGNVAIALLANSLATGAALAALILACGPISGAHFNPVVTMVEAVQGRLPPRQAVRFTSSTSFANPAVTAARALTNTFTGIRPADVPAFLVGQVGGAVASMVVCRWLAGGARRRQIEFESGATLR